MFNNVYNNLMTRLKMGSAYTSLSTQDPNDVLVGRGLMKSSSSYMDKHPIRRPAVHKNDIGALAAVRPGMVISGGKDQQIILNNIDTGESVLQWSGHRKEVTKVVYKNASGKHFVLSGSRDLTVKLWQFNSNETQRTYEGHEMSISGLVMYDGKHFASGSRDTTVRLWDVETGKNIRIAQHSRNLVTHMSYYPAGNLIAQSSEDKEMKLWDSRSLELVHQFRKKLHIQTHCDFVPDGNYVLSSSNGFNGDGCEITVWDVRQRKLLRELRGHDETVTCVTHMPQQVTWKRLVLSVGLDRTCRIWNLDEGLCLWAEQVPPGVDLLACVGFNDGNVVVSGNEGTLTHLRLMGKAGRPYLHCVSYQSSEGTTSESCYDMRDRTF